MCACRLESWTGTAAAEPWTLCAVSTDRSLSCCSLRLAARGAPQLRTSACCCTRAYGPIRSSVQSARQSLRTEQRVEIRAGVDAGRVTRVLVRRGAVPRGARRRLARSAASTGSDDEDGTVGTCGGGWEGERKIWEEKIEEENDMWALRASG